MSEREKKEFLTETHKVRYTYKKYEFEYYVVLTITFFLASYLFVEYLFLTDLFLTEKEVVYLRQLDKTISELHKRKTDYSTLKYYYEEKKKIEDKKPYFITLFHLVSKLKQKDETKSRKIYFVLGYLAWYLGGCFLSFYLLLRWFKSKEKFFLQIPKKEEIYVFRKEKTIDLNYMFGTKFPFANYFSDVNKVNNFINSSVIVEQEGLFEKKIKKGDKFKNFVEKMTKEYLNYVEVFYPFLLEEKEKVEFYFKFILWHYVLNLYGNLPTGILTPLLKDENFKIILGVYQRKLLPVIYVKQKKSAHSSEYKVTYLKEKFFSYFFLRSFYETEKIFDLFKTVENKFSPFKFEIPIKYQ